jgi:alpha-galactosidase
MLRFEFDGQDMMPGLHRWMVKQARTEQERLQKDPTGSTSKGAYNHTYALQLWDIFGVMPDNTSHTKEYVPYYQGFGVKPVEPEPLRLFDAVHRAKLMAEAWQVTEEYASGKKSAEVFLRDVPNDHASDIIESMWGGLGQPFFINTFNRGAVPNMPADAFLELRSDLDMQGPRPRPVCAMPRGVLGLQQVVLDTHELTAEAAVTGDRGILRRAMLTDPLCNNIADADACIAELLQAQRDVLPRYWYR